LRAMINDAFMEHSNSTGIRTLELGGTYSSSEIGEDEELYELMIVIM
jgi:hypothetical protein